MRYIDDMIKGIPLEEMTGGTDIMENNENNTIRSIIPDTKREIPLSESSEEGYVQSIITEQQNEPEAPAKKAKKGRPAKVKSKGLGVLAAALALVVSAGAITAYFGVVKHTGPLSWLSDQQNDVPADVAEANANAKEVFVQINGFIADKVSDGRIREIDCLEGTHIVDLTVLDLLDNGDFKDRITECSTHIPKGKIAFNVTDRKVRWTQWTAGDGSFVGQYPEPAKSTSPTLGEFFLDPAYTDNYVNEVLDGTYTGMTHANALSNCISNEVTNRLFGNDKDEYVTAGEHILDLSEQSDFLDKIAEFSGHEIKTYTGKVLYYIGADRRVKYVCWQSGDGALIEDYIYGVGASGETHAFEEYPAAAKEVMESGSHYYHDIIQRVSVMYDSYAGFAGSDYYELLYPYTDEVENINFEHLYQAYCEGRLTKVEPQAPKAYTVMICNSIYDPETGDCTFMQSSDRADADVIINDEYYTYDGRTGFDAARSFFLNLYNGNITNEQDIWFQQQTAVDGANYADASEITFRSVISGAEYSNEEVRRQYGLLEAANLKPVTDPGRSLNNKVQYRAGFWKDGSLISISTTDYEYANIQIGNTYYHTDDTTILDMIKSAFGANT